MDNPFPLRLSPSWDALQRTLIPEVNGVFEEKL